MQTQSPDVWHSSSGIVQEYIHESTNVFGVDVTAVAATAVALSLPLSSNTKTDRTHCTLYEFCVLFPLHTKAHIIFPASAHASLYLTNVLFTVMFILYVCRTLTHTLARIGEHEHKHKHTTNFVAIVTHFRACIFSRQTHIVSIHVKHLCCLSLSRSIRTNAHILCDVFQHYIYSAFSAKCVRVWWFFVWTHFNWTLVVAVVFLGILI